VALALAFSSDPGDVVYEPFAGSGSTIIAAEQTGRRCIAIEIDPHYAQVAIERWASFTGETPERIDG
jgi:DNA modification methylase